MKACLSHGCMLFHRLRAVFCSPSLKTRRQRWLPLWPTAEDSWLVSVQPIGQVPPSTARCQAPWPPRRLPSAPPSRVSAWRVCSGTT